QAPCQLSQRFATPDEGIAFGREAQRFGRADDFRHRPYETVAAPRKCLDPAFSTGYARQNPTDRRDLDCKVGFLDHQVRPRGIEDASLRYEFVRVLDERLKNRNRTRSEG